MAAVHDTSDQQTSGLHLLLQRMENEGVITKNDVKTFFSDIRLPAMGEKKLKRKMKDAGASELGKY